MQSPKYLLPYLFLFCLSGLAARAQETGLAILDSLNTILTRSAAQTQPSDLFLHLDKTVYVRGENIWFTAYVLGGDTTLRLHTLHTVLIEEASKKVLAAERFALEEGTGGGAIFLPDSLPIGEYRLVAYTNQFRSHPRQPVFQQAISLKGGEQNSFRLSLLPAATQAISADSVSFGYKVLTSYGGLASGGELAYTILADGNPVRSGKEKVDAFGEVRFQLSRQLVAGKRVQLQATVSRDKVRQTFRTDVPLLLNEAMLRLYPEGGQLIHLHPTSLAIEIRDGIGTPIATSGQLLVNGKPIQDFQTNRSGTAILPITPVHDRRYTIRLSDSSYRLVYQFPAIQQAGYGLHLPQAVVTDSSVAIEIITPGQGTCHLLAHNYREIFFSGTLRTAKDRALLRLPADNMPEGIVTLTLFDAAGAPQAERTILVRRQAPLKVQLSTDSAIYHHRSKLQLRVKVTDAGGAPVRAMFSLACVLSIRIDTSRAADIVRFQQFDRFLPAAATMPGIDFFSSDANIEQLLLTRFWTRYRWEDFNKTNLASPVIADRPCDTGYVLYRDKPLTKPVTLMMVGTSPGAMFETDAAGRFALPPQMLLVEQGRKNFLVVADTKRSMDYRIVLHNECAPLDTQLAQQSWPAAGYIQAALSVQEQEHLRKALQAVVVTAQKTPSFARPFKSLTCNDWVCMYNILNCPNHPTGSRPVNGMIYGYRGQQVVYEDCAADDPQGSLQKGFLQQVDGIAIPKEFYVADYEKFNPTEPELLSTVYWNYRIVTNSEGEAVVQFPTNDLNGRFTCVLQGITGQGAISGRYYFKVVE